MPGRSGGKGTLDGMSGSFMNQEQREKLYGHIQSSGMADAMEQGETSPDLLSEEEVSGLSANTSTNPTENKEKKHVPDDAEPGDICPECGKILIQEIEFSDEELMNYLLGARVSRTLQFGPISFRIQSLTQREVDDANYRTGRDVDSGNALLEVDIQNRLSFYFMVYQLMEINGKRIFKEMPKDPSVEEFENWHNDAIKVIKSYGHTLLTTVSRWCSRLEDSLRETLDNEVRLKK